MLKCVKTAVDVYQGFISPTRRHHLFPSPASLASGLQFFKVVINTYGETSYSAFGYDVQQQRSLQGYG
jgi:hypothetical protein